MAIEDRNMNAHFVRVAVLGLNFILGSICVVDTDYVVKGKVVDKVVELLFLPFGHEGMVQIIFQQTKKVRKQLSQVFPL